jgi:hypothetical protein
MNATLTFEYEFSRDDDDFGWVMVRVETPDFSGRNGTWAQWQDVREFGATLSRFPIELTNPVTCEWGFGEGRKQQVVTRVVIAPEGATGGLIVDVEIANHYDPRNRCRTRFQTDYPSVARFREQIEAMMRKEAPSAALEGTKANVD